MKEITAAFQTTPTPDKVKGRKPTSSLRPYMLLLPAVLLVVLVMMAPLIYSIAISFFSMHYLKIGKFIGFANYLAFWHGEDNYVRNTLVFVFGSLAVTWPLSMLLAVALNQNVRFTNLFRAILILPWAVSQVVTGLLWLWLLNSDYSAISYVLLKYFSIDVDFLSTPAPAMFSLILANVWQSFGYPTLLVLAALQTVPSEMLEAAELDGIGRFRRFFFITLPWIKQSVLVAFIMLSIHYVNLVTIPLILTGGGPAGTTDIMSLGVYREAFDFNHYGVASAVAVYMFLFNIIFTLIYMRLTKAKTGEAR